MLSRDTRPFTLGAINADTFEKCYSLARHLLGPSRSDGQTEEVVSKAYGAKEGLSFLSIVCSHLLTFH
jgi:hypothetical protein